MGIIQSPLSPDGGDTMKGDPASHGGGGAHWGQKLQPCVPFKMLDRTLLPLDTVNWPQGQVGESSEKLAGCEELRAE